MIHFFDGFNWPVDALVANSSITGQPPSVFVHPLATTPAYRYPDNGKGLVGLRHGSNSSVAKAGYRIVSRDTLKFVDGKLVVGGTGITNTANTSSYFALILSYPTDNTLPAFVTDAMSIERSRLPSLVVTEGAIYLRQTTNNTSTNPTTLAVASRALTGVSITKNHWYEVVYDTNLNTIEVFIDDVSVLLFDYVFSEEEKQYEYRLSAHICAVNGPYAESILRTVYVADERLGPCKVVAKYVDEDISVPAAFGAGPHYQKLNDSFAAGSTALTTKENATAEFGLNGEDIVGDIKAVSVLSRLSSTHRSAYETEAKLKYGLKLPQGTWTSESKDVPQPSVLSQRIDQIVMQNNPLTGAPFTAEEVNALGLSLTFDITNKF